MTHTPHKWNLQPKTSHAQFVTGLVGDKLMSPARLPRKRAVRACGGPRKPYDRAEDRLRPKVRDRLRKLGCTVFKLEPSGRGCFGVADLLVFKGCRMWFMELKTPKGVISDDQLTFKKLCDTSMVRYVVIRSVEEAEKIAKDTT